MNDENGLLRRYVDESSESAFAELVRKYIDLIYSAALRQVEGDPHLAEEVTQSVFLDLAWKSHSLVEHPSLLGWLYTATRFTAINACRAQQRRRAHEQKAEFMLDQDSDSSWQELCPVLDEAMHSLNSKDREAVLLRFFERLTLSQIGLRWGTTENTARMRVERAIDKLRRALQKKGLLMTAFATGTLLTSRAVTACPSELAARIEGALSSITIYSPPQSNLLSTLWSRTKLAPFAGVLILMTCVLVLLLKHLMPTAMSLKEGRGVAPVIQVVDARFKTAKALPAKNPSTAKIGPQPGNTAIEIHAIAADSGEPIPNMMFKLRTFAEGKWAVHRFWSTRFGVAQIEYPENISQFELMSVADEFADTRLVWRPDRGDQIPLSYILRLTRAIQIGGWVVDNQGSPVAGAKVGFNHSDFPDPTSSPEGHKFMWIETETDSTGRWRINRIAPEMLSLIYGSAKHPEHSGSEVISLPEHPEVLSSLTNGVYSFQLGQSSVINGVVLDLSGKPIVGAQVATSMTGSSTRREAVTGNDGRFIVNATPGAGYIAARADGYAPTSIKVLKADADQQVELRLGPGKKTRFLVLDTEGRPIERARLYLDEWNTEFVENKTNAATPLQFEVVLNTDAEGRAVWTNAPDLALRFSVSAEGYMRGQGMSVYPSEKEYIFTLDRALDVSGTVQDTSGKPVHRYRIAVGWAERIFPNNKIVPRWSSIDRFALTFSRSVFSFTLDEPVLTGNDEHGYFLKFSAEGFVPYVTPLINPKQGAVSLNIELQPVTKRMLHVIDSQGIPVLNAPTLFLPDGWWIHGSPNGFEQVSDEMHVVKTNTHGEVPLQMDPELTSFLVACSAGCINLPTSEIPEDGTVRLKPWGRISGRVVENGQPCANQLVIWFRHENMVEFRQLSRPLPAMIFTTGQVTSDQDGLFSFANVPPGATTVAVVRQISGPDGFKVPVHLGKTEVEVKDQIPTEIVIELAVPGSKKAEP